MNFNTLFTHVLGIQELRAIHKVLDWTKLSIAMWSQNFDPLAELDYLKKITKKNKHMKFSTIFGVF